MADVRADVEKRHAETDQLLHCYHCSRLIVWPSKISLSKPKTPKMRTHPDF
jgi:hypothetical protein